MHAPWLPQLLPPPPHHHHHRQSRRRTTACVFAPSWPSLPAACPSPEGPTRAGRGRAAASAAGQPRSPKAAAAACASSCCLAALARPRSLPGPPPGTAASRRQPQPLTHPHRVLLRCMPQPLVLLFQPVLNGGALLHKLLARHQPHRLVLEGGLHGLGRGDAKLAQPRPRRRLLLRLLILAVRLLALLQLALDAPLVLPRACAARAGEGCVVWEHDSKRRQRRRQRRRRRRRRQTASGSQAWTLLTHIAAHAEVRHVGERLAAAGPWCGRAGSERAGGALWAGRRTCKS